MSDEGGDEVAREDVEALLEVRRELGPSYDAALVDSFADRIERAVSRRVDDRLDHQRALVRQGGGGQTRQFVLGVVSLGVGVPITIVPLVAADSLAGVVVSWLGIAAVNAAHAAAVNGSARHLRPGR